MSSILRVGRVLLVLLFGNALGAAAWQFALWAIPHLWQDRQPSEQTFFELIGLTALTFMLLATPPVLIGALGGAVSNWIARGWGMWVGLGCGLWALALIQATPPEFPIAAKVWYAPTVLILFSGAVGGWLMDLRPSRPVSQ
jgi:hypothetical protein